jgi:outer membrane protein assembly factor BamB
VKPSESSRRVVWLPLLAVAALAAGCGEARDATDWALSNHDLASTRATASTGIDARTVQRLQIAWRFPIPAPAGAAGAVTATPVVVDGVVYLQDMRSNVYAIDLKSGHERWRHRFNAVNPGPDGVAVAGGRIFGATDQAAFALSASTGKLLWQRLLTSPAELFVDVAPQVAGNDLYMSTLGEGPNGKGALYALDARTGKLQWRRSTILGRWRDPAEAGGGGAWYPPSVSGDTVYWGTGNPYPFGGTVRHPNGGAYAGPALYTDSLLAVDRANGRLRWYDQVTPHDVRDYDFQLPPILSGEAVIGAGKGGTVVAWDSASHRRIWTARVGVHKNDSGPLPHRRVSVCPGLLGGVETPMAAANGRVFVPIVNLCMRGSDVGYEPLDKVDPSRGTGQLVALDVRTGRQLWRRRLPQPDFGCATVSADVVFTSTFNGTVYGLAANDGSVLWKKRLPAGINACPSVAGGTLLLAAGIPSPGRGRPQLVALRSAG